VFIGKLPSTKLAHLTYTDLQNSSSRFLGHNVHKEKKTKDLKTFKSIRVPIQRCTLNLHSS